MEYVYIGLIILVIVVLTFLKSPKGRGLIGELQVRIVLGKNKENEKYVINDLTVVVDGKSSQIDHILINQKGIFVIETKNYSGRIYGNENVREWTQVLQYGRVKNKLYNPIMQNKSHIYALSQVLNRSDCFVSIIVFPKAELVVEARVAVGHLGIIKRELKQARNNIFTIDEIKDIYETLLNHKNNPQVTSKEHIRSIKKMQSSIEQNICPRCGSPLVLKKSSYGDFYGCSNYPKCRFTKK